MNIVSQQFLSIYLKIRAPGVDSGYQSVSFGIVCCEVNSSKHLREANVSQLARVYNLKGAMSRNESKLRQWIPPPN